MQRSCFPTHAPQILSGRRQSGQVSYSQGKTRLINSLIFNDYSSIPMDAHPASLFFSLTQVVDSLPGL